jgi:hypothetical protein
VHLVGNTAHDNGWWEGHDHFVYYKNGTDAYIANNLVYGDIYGFAVHIYASDGNDGGTDALITGNTFIGRNDPATPYEKSAVVFSTLAARNIVSSNIMADWRSTAFGDGAAVRTGGTPGSNNKVVNNLLYNNRLGVTCGTTVCDDTSGNVTADPKFLSPSTRDYRLGAASPALNLMSAAHRPAKDHDHVARPQGSGPDAGAFEFGETASGDNTPPETTIPAGPRCPTSGPQLASGARPVSRPLAGSILAPRNSSSHLHAPASAPDPAMAPGHLPATWTNPRSDRRCRGRGRSHGNQCVERRYGGR